MTVILLGIHVVKEILEMYIEGKDYFTTFENAADWMVTILVCVCQFYYWGTAKREYGYYMPEEGSYFEVFLLPTMLFLHLNLILQHLIAFKLTRQYVVMIV